MNYKQKHPEDLEAAKCWLAIAKENNNKIAIQILEGLFPELSESEDELMRKEAISIIKQYNIICEREGDKCYTADRVISWLEKQGNHNEQNFWEKCNHCEYFDGYDLCLHKKNFGSVTNKSKENCKKNKFFIEKQDEKWVNENNDEIALSEQNNADKVKPKFKVGDWVVYNRDDYSREIIQVYDIREGRYYFTDNVHFSWSIKECDEKSHLWTIQDAKDGDVLSDEDPFIFRGFGDKKHPNNPTAYCGINVSGTFILSTGNEWWTSRVPHPATKEQRDLLFQKMKEAGYEWDAEKKELKKIEQESTLNEKIKGLNELETYILSLVPDRSLDAIKVDAKNIKYIINKEQNTIKKNMK